VSLLLPSLFELALAHTLFSGLQLCSRRRGWLFHRHKRPIDTGPFLLSFFFCEPEKYHVPTPGPPCLAGPPPCTDDDDRNELPFRPLTSGPAENQTVNVLLPIEIRLDRQNASQVPEPTSFAVPESVVVAVTPFILPTTRPCRPH
jgi:hypothetical protein